MLNGFRLYGNRTLLKNVKNYDIIQDPHTISFSWRELGDWPKVLKNYVLNSFIAVQIKRTTIVIKIVCAWL